MTGPLLLGAIVTPLRSFDGDLGTRQPARTYDNGSVLQLCHPPLRSSQLAFNRQSPVGEAYRKIARHGHVTSHLTTIAKKVAKSGAFK